MRRLGALMAVVVAVGLGACGGRSGSQVTSDLQQLLDQNGVQGTAGACVHQNGNQYICQVTGTANGTVTVYVTDDGNHIYESGIAAP